MKNNAVAGNTLISLLFFLIVLGVISKPMIDYYESWKDHKATAETNERIEAINAAIRNYVTANGRYPCPAPMAAAFDTPTFGKESTTGCKDGTAAANDLNTASKRVTGKDGRFVRIGAVPVRTLGLPDKAIHDGYGHRYIYTVTESFAGVAPNFKMDKGAVILKDSSGNNATEAEGNIVFAVTSMGDDIAGSYNVSGMMLTQCKTGSASYENCNYDATLVNTVNKSMTEGNQKFTQSIRFKTTKACENESKTNPGKMAYLLDTSTSMKQSAKCPPNYTGTCDKMDAAHWALRRGLAGRQLATKGLGLTTNFTGFHSKDEDEVKDYISNPNKLTVAEDEDVEKLVNKTCYTDFGTPVGMHVKELAKRLGPGTAENPNSILVVSDGMNNRGQEPDEIADWIKEKYGNKIAVHIVYLSPRGNDKPTKEEKKGLEKLQYLAEKTNGKFLETKNPEEVEQFLYDTAGICEPPNPPKDKVTCDSKAKIEE